METGRNRRTNGGWGGVPYLLFAVAVFAALVKLGGSVLAEPQLPLLPDPVSAASETKAVEEDSAAERPEPPDKPELVDIEVPEPAAAEPPGTSPPDPPAGEPAEKPLEEDPDVQTSEPGGPEGPTAGETVVVREETTVVGQPANARANARAEARVSERPDSEGPSAEARAEARAGAGAEGDGTGQQAGGEEAVPAEEPPAEDAEPEAPEREEASEQDAGRPGDDPAVFRRPEPRAGGSAPSGASGRDAATYCGTLGRFPEGSRAVFPVPAEYQDSYTNDWGAPRPNGGHEGTDLMIPFGTPEFAITDGTVVPVAGNNGRGWNNLGGYAVMVRADRNLGPIRRGDLFYYAHLDEPTDLRIGDKVRAGEIVGYAGDTGYGPEITRGQFPPHLHFGWYDTSGSRTNLPSGAMNPYPLLEWLKDNGGKVSGGSNVPFCEAPQPADPDPAPSTGEDEWLLPTTPGVTPDLDTGSEDWTPSPAAETPAEEAGDEAREDAADEEETDEAREESEDALEEDDVEEAEGAGPGTTGSTSPEPDEPEAGPTEEPQSSLQNRPGLPDAGEMGERLREQARERRERLRERNERLRQEIRERVEEATSRPPRTTNADDQPEEGTTPRKERNNLGTKPAAKTQDDTRDNRDRRAESEEEPGCAGEEPCEEPGPTTDPKDAPAEDEASEKPVEEPDREPPETRTPGDEPSASDAAGPPSSRPEIDKATPRETEPAGEVTTQ